MPNNTNTVTDNSPNGTTTTSTLSDWAGPYVTSMLGKAQAVAGMPYQMYGGQMTAGPSSLQNQAFSGIAGLTLPSNTTNYDPMTFSSRLPGTSASDPYAVGSVQSYMDPYIGTVLNNQIAELQRQAAIDRINTHARLDNQGAYGGSRQAIEDAEGSRNLLTKIGDVTGTAYSNAFTNAQAQQLKAAQLGLQAQEDTDKSNQFGAGLGLQQGQFGLDKLKEQAALGDTQRGIQQQGLDADYAEFQRQRDYPKQQLQFMQSMLTGLPISTVTNSPNGQSTGQKISGGISDLVSLLNTLGIT